MQITINLLLGILPELILPALGGTVMSLGYQKNMQAGGSCPVVLPTGDTETSKRMVLKAAISLTGKSEVKG